ncbi:MAG TPA: cell division protein ZipA C-terminal FtsZ-binding domain-containing protein, partial [Gammaproteobacteria bacterium]|nr:cell division protein ZipA C-terminal FtsZ-binding domain-containing protein [Gammaproteobacteria bacterium]
MWDLRWVLIGLGALVVIGVYLWSKGLFSRALPQAAQRRQRSEPTIGGTPAEEPAAPTDDRPLEPAPVPSKQARSTPERIITLRLVPRGEELPMERAVDALKSLGLEHGRYGIFHRMLADQPDEPAFSVASLTEPGTFDLDRLADQTIAGLTLFVVLPGMGDAVARFDAMVEVARALSVELEADLLDERGSS